MTWKQNAVDEYYLEEDKYSYAKLWKIGLSSGERQRRGIGLYGVATRIGRDGVETKKTFKTRSEAVAELKEILKEKLK